MAIGADYSLPKSQPSVLRPQAAPAKQAAPQYGAMPPAIADSAVSDAVNNQLAASAGVGRASYNDRAGISRGRGQQFRADMTQAAADAKARAGAAQTEMGAESANAAARSAYENTMNDERLSYGGLLEGLRSNSATERLARRGWQQSLNEAIRRGQFSLDQIQPDYSSLITSLLQ